MVYKGYNKTYDFRKFKTKFSFDNDIRTGTGLKILTPKQIPQKLPIALAQVQAGNNSENLLNEMRRIVYSLYQSKEITKKACNSIIKSIQI